jgi:hypothetical protein
MSAAPPTTPVTDLGPPRTIWPTVCGVIGIVWGSLSLLCGCAGYFSVASMKWFASMVPAGDPQATQLEVQVHVMERFALATYVLTTISLLLAVLLLVASIGLTRRRRWSRKACAVWAMIAMAVVLVNLAYNYMYNMAVWARLDELGLPRQPGAEIIFIVTLIAILLFGWLWPVFLLLWLSRPKIRDEVNRWDNTTPASI